ncbi:MAG: class I SAM-dependent methyltransferase [Anaerolineales bacterium]|jgi:ubiquinone/menaquinone biosynthesis C-methylase UbiE
MAGKGEASFAKLPGFGAWLYERLMSRPQIDIQHREIAEDWVSRIISGRILDVGTGPGKLLLEIHKLNPGLELFGLDISASMVHLARRILAGTGANLRQGNIRGTNYREDFFDLITCTGSFYLWENPDEGLKEMHRILRPGSSAFLYETYRDIDQAAYRRALESKLRSERPWVRRILAGFLQKQIRMTYRTEEIEEILRQSVFSKGFSFKRVDLAGLPIWLRIQLIKHPS